jgi:hypothetical protein
MYTLIFIAAHGTVLNSAFTYLVLTPWKYHFEIFLKNYFLQDEGDNKYQDVSRVETEKLSEIFQMIQFILR